MIRALSISLQRKVARVKVRATISLRATFLILFAMLATAGPLDLSAWKYRKRIPLTPGEGLAVVKLDKEVYAEIGDLAWSLRVLRDQEEVPFVFKTPGREDDHVIDV